MIQPNTDWFFDIDSMYFPRPFHIDIWFEADPDTFEELEDGWCRMEGTLNYFNRLDESRHSFRYELGWLPDLSDLEIPKEKLTPIEFYRHLDWLDWYLEPIDDDDYLETLQKETNKNRV